MFAKPLNKQSWKLAKMKIWHHFYSKKDCSYTRICKRNFFLMHGIQEMNFFSFGTLLGSNVFWKKVKVNNKILQNWVCLMFLLGLRKFFSILRFIHFMYQSFNGHFCVFFNKIFVFGLINSVFFKTWNLYLFHVKHSTLSGNNPLNQETV